MVDTFGTSVVAEDAIEHAARGFLIAFTSRSLS